MLVLLNGGRRGAEEVAALLGGGARRREAEQLLNVLPDRHGAEDVEEDERTVSVVLAGQVAVRQALDPRDGRERQLGHHPAVETSKINRQTSPIVVEMVNIILELSSSHHRN